MDFRTWIIRAKDGTFVMANGGHTAFAGCAAQFLTKSDALYASFRGCETGCEVLEVRNHDGKMIYDSQPLREHPDFLNHISSAVLLVLLFSFSTFGQTTSAEPAADGFVWISLAIVIAALLYAAAREVVRTNFRSRRRIARKISHRVSLFL